MHILCKSLACLLDMIHMMNRMKSTFRLEGIYQRGKKCKIPNFHRMLNMKNRIECICQFLLHNILHSIQHNHFH